MPVQIAYQVWSEPKPQTYNMPTLCYLNLMVIFNGSAWSFSKMLETQLVFFQLLKLIVDILIVLTNPLKPRGKNF